MVMLSFGQLECFGVTAMGKAGVKVQYFFVSDSAQFWRACKLLKALFNMNSSAIEV